MTCWDIDQHHARDRIAAGTTVVDLGASTGEFASPARDAGASVLCVEIVPSNCAWLRVLGLTAIHAAAGPHDGWATLVETGPAEYATGCHAEPSDIQTGLYMLSLDTIVNMAGPIGVLKCDIEGGEYALFETATRDAMTEIDFLAVETHEWTTPDEPRRPGIGVRDGKPYVPDALRRLIAKLGQTHDVEYDSGVVYGALRA